MRNLLAGKKSYIVAGFMVLKGALTLVGVLDGDPQDAVREIVEGLGLATLRAGVTKSGPLGGA